MPDGSLIFDTHLNNDGAIKDAEALKASLGKKNVEIPLTANGDDAKKVAEATKKAVEKTPIQFKFDVSKTKLTEAEKAKSRPTRSLLMRI